MADLTLEDNIDIFHLYVDDTDELSSDEELALGNRIYQKVARARPWLALRVPYTGVLSTSVPYIAVPSDFVSLAPNYKTNDNEFQVNPGENTRVIYIGSNYTPYSVVNFADRRNYLNQSNICYYDAVNRRIVFAVQPTQALSYEYDYQKKPADLALADVPFFPVAQEIIGHGMAVDGFIIQLFDKARSYALENNAKYQDLLNDLAMWDASLQNL